MLFDTNKYKHLTGRCSDKISRVNNPSLKDKTLIMESTFPQMAAKVNMSKYDVGSSHLVEVTHINDPKSFFVRLICFKDDVQSLEEKGIPLEDKDAKIGKRVIYKSKMLGKFVRGDIKFILFRQTSVVCNIFAIDYGCQENKVKQKNIFLPKYNIPCPPLAVHCELYLCEPKGEEFDSEALDAMRYFVGTHTAKITIMANTLDKLTVELKTLECPDDVSTMLGLLHFTTLTTGEQSVNQFSQVAAASQPIKYKYKQLKVGDMLHVRVQSGECIRSFFVAELNDYKQMIQNANQFVEYCKRQPMQDVSAAAADGRCCGLRVNRSVIYERAIVKNITVPDSKALVQLVDWGKEIECHFCDIKRVVSEVHTILPAIAIHCSSTDDQTWDNGLPKFLYTGYEFIIQIIELGNGTDVPHKVNILQTQKI